MPASPAAAQVLGGIKAEGGGIAQGSGCIAVPLRAPGLGGIFNQLEVAAFGHAVESAQSATGRRGEPAEWLGPVFPAGPSRTISTAVGLEVEGDRVDVGQEGLCSGPQNRS